MKEILDKYKEICQVLFLEDIDDEVLIAKIHRKIDSSINTLEMIFDSVEIRSDSWEQLEWARVYIKNRKD